MADDNHVPASPEAYLPNIVGDIKNVTIDTSSPLYVAARKSAHAAGLTQNQFGRMLAIEAERVTAARSKSAPTAETPAPATPAAPAKALKDMTFTERMIAAGHV